MRSSSADGGTMALTRRNLDIPSESDLGVDCLLNLCRCRVGKGQNHEIKRRSRRRPLELAALFMGATIHLKQFGATQATLESYTAVICCEEPHHCKQEVCSGIILEVTPARGAPRSG